MICINCPIGWNYQLTAQVDEVKTNTIVGERLIIQTNPIVLLSGVINNNVTYNETFKLPVSTDLDFYTYIFTLKLYNKDEERNKF